MKRVILFIGILVAIATLYACESKSGKRVETSITDVVVLIDDIAQRGDYIYFIMIDTIEFQVRNRPYVTHISNVRVQNDSAIFVALAYLDSKEYFTTLEIKKK